MPAHFDRWIIVLQPGFKVKIESFFEILNNSHIHLYQNILEHPLPIRVYNAWSASLPIDNSLLNLILIWMI
jgi:hypothetical protein